MSEDAAAIPLPSIVGSVLDVEGGTAVTSALAVLDHHAVLLGTSAGSLLLLCSQSGEHDAALTPLSESTLHCGPVHDISISTQQLVATAGHDAVCCVFSLAALLRDGGGGGVAKCRRIAGHTAPVVALCFLTDGTSLAALGADGQLLVADARSGAVLASVSCGFAACCLARSLDETQLYVGGHSLTCIDLHHAVRPTSLQTMTPAPGAVHIAAAQHRTPAALRLLEWEGAAGQRECRTSRHTSVCTLSVDAADGSLTALFARHGAPPAPPLEVCGRAYWAAGTARLASQTAWSASALPDGSAALQRALLKRRGIRATAEAARVRVRCPVRRAARASAKHAAAPAALRSSTVSAAVWGGRWYTSRVALPDSPRCRLPCEAIAAATGAGEGAAAAAGRDAPESALARAGLGVFPHVGPRTPAEELAVAQGECDALQGECDALVHEIKQLLSQKSA